MVLILTEWNEFRALDLARLSDVMNEAHMADLRNIYNAQKAREAGFKSYVAVGRG